MGLLNVQLFNPHEPEYKRMLRQRLHQMQACRDITTPRYRAETHPKVGHSLAYEDGFLQKGVILAGQLASQLASALTVMQLPVLRSRCCLFVARLSHCSHDSLLT